MRHQVLQEEPAVPACAVEQNSQQRQSHSPQHIAAAHVVSHSMLQGATRLQLKL